MSRACSTLTDLKRMTYYAIKTERLPSKFVPNNWNFLTRRVVMMEDGYHIVERQVKIGCPQGSVLGPKFWNLVMDGLLRQLEELPSTQAIAYADNLVILIPGNSRRALEERGVAAMAILESWASS